MNGDNISTRHKLKHGTEISYQGTKGPASALTETRLVLQAPRLRDRGQQRNQKAFTWRRPREEPGAQDFCGGGGWKRLSREDHQALRVRSVQARGWARPERGSEVPS